MNACPVLQSPRLRIAPATHQIVLAAMEGPDPLAALVGAQPAAGWRPAQIAEPKAGPMQGFAPNRAMVILKDENRIIGDVRFEPVGQGSRLTYEIGYGIAPAYRRQGYASEAMRQIIRWLDEDVGADEIVAGCHMENGASVRTLLKLGFLLDGSTPDRHAFWWIWEDWGRAG